MSEPSQDRLGYGLILLGCIVVALVVVGLVWLVVRWLSLAHGLEVI